MTDTDRMMVWLRETLDAAQSDAEAARDAHQGVYASEGDAEWYHEPTDGVFTKPHGIQVTPGVPYVDPDVEPHIARQSPAAVLRRIAADRKTLEQCEKTLAVDGWEYTDAPELAEHVIRNLAEGWGWTEETTTGE